MCRPQKVKMVICGTHRQFSRYRPIDIQSVVSDTVSYQSQESLGNLIIIGSNEFLIGECVYVDAVVHLYHGYPSLGVIRPINSNNK
jgi:hypothetical protein